MTGTAGIAKVVRAIDKKKVIANTVRMIQHSQTTRSINAGFDENNTQVLRCSSRSIWSKLLRNQVIA
jgi:hypothetical protein